MNDGTGGQPHEEENPFAAPQVADTALSSDPELVDAERVRREHISHEMSLKSIGFLYYIGAVLCGIAAAALTGVDVAEAAGPRGPGTAMWMGTVYGAIAVLLIVVGRGLRKLKPWIRLPVGIVSVLGLLGFPCGTLISVYVLYLVISPKAAIVLSPQYQQIIAQTPHVRYQTSPFTWIVLAVFVALLAGLVVMMSLGG